MKKHLTILILSLAVQFAFGQNGCKDSVSSSFCYSQIVKSGRVLIWYGPNYDDEADVFWRVVEDHPQFPGGETARLKYLKGNLKYPQSAIDSGIQGTVFVSLTIYRDGSIAEVRLLRGIGGGCDEEAIRLVAEMPNWVPGKQKGKTVNVIHDMPIRFQLDTLIYDNVDVAPEFPGGDSARLAYLRERIYIPNPRHSYDTPQGTLFIGFVVERDGSISNVEVVRSIGNGIYDEHAIRAMEEMPKWIPGKQRGEAVRVRYMMPLRFVLND
ncbi:MAG: energy transducer TonB [Bacteroidales bacterium]|nr:energy transducer TonB [Bacteroidales bacterium]